MADDEDGPEVNGEDVSTQVAREDQADPSQGVATEDDWVNIVAQNRLRSGRVRQESSQEDALSSTQSFRESQGLVRCSIRESRNEKERPQKRKRKGKGKGHKVPTVTKTQNSDVVVANTRLPGPADSPDIERSRSQPSEQAIVLETQSSTVPLGSFDSG